ncbi:MAG: phytanoyl-CoA dioxygenase family protein [Acidobacteriota bacterium]
MERGAAVVHQEEASIVDLLSERQWHEFDRAGFLRLGPVLDGTELAGLQQRMDDIMLGRFRYPALRFQLDTGGKYEELPDAVPEATEQTLAYRKVQGLEADPLMLDLIRRPLFREICGRQYGRHAGVSIFRAMMMNKPAGKGTYLPWHQDAGDVWKLDRDPLVTIWIAFDDATPMNGCMQAIPGSHRLGLLSRDGSTLSAEDAERHCPDSKIVDLDIPAGEALLLHNWLIHRSGINHTDTPRRAMTTCYMDARTRTTLTGATFPLVFGNREDLAIDWPFLDHVTAENQRLRETAVEAERYASSLVAHAAQVEQMRRDTETYAKSLEAELTRIRAEARAATGGGI